MDEINFAEIEKKWQKTWEEKKVFEVGEDFDKEKFYVLEMFPYPSGAGLHMGHALNYTIGDILARFKIMKGFNVLHPMGFDALGLPAENAAIKAGIDPEKYTNDAIGNFVKQQKALGVSYDWSRMVNTASSEYYKWDQWIFLKMLEKGLAYQKEASVNWCPKCDTVLANEQVEEGKCWRHEDTEVEVRKLRQWFFRTTEYAEELLSDLDNIDWPERTKTMQRNWIGRSHGTEILFAVEGLDCVGKARDKSRKSSPSEEKLSCAGGLGNVVIVHGCDSNKESANDKRWGVENLRHWKPWLKEKLGKHGIGVSNELYAENWKPNYEKWKEHFEENDINENSILVGHSCGCAFLVRWLGETKKKIKKLILVAPWKIADEDKHGNGEIFDIRKRFYDYEIDSYVNQNVDEIIFFTSNDEDDAGKESLKLYRNVLKGRVIELKNHGHYTFGDMGTREFPELLDEILSANDAIPSLIESLNGLGHANGRESSNVWKVFTTRPDTIFGVTFMVVAAGHDRLDELVTNEQRLAVDEYLKKMNSVSEKDIERREKEGVFSGSYAVNPATGERVPIWIGNFVLADYGSGMVMGVPAHDRRDFDFAKKYGISVRQVVCPIYGDPHEKDIHRETITAVVRRKEDDKYLMIKWKKFGWISPVIGGIENGESIEEAAKREVLEETGYSVNFVRRLEAKTQQHFYAENKEVWRSRIDHPVLLELTGEEQMKISCEEENKHDIIWLDKDEILEKMTHEENLAGFLDYFGKSEAYVGDGKLCNSKEFDGVSNVEGKIKITDWLAAKGNAKRVVNFKLRDWGVSRQRYWGTPIPIVYCEKCGVVSIPEKDLPVVLPKEVKFGKGNPLETNEEWLNCKCPRCGKVGRRESDTMDTFVNSSWYFLRYADPKNSEKIFDFDKVKYWNPVDVYIGGAEHACMHLLYSRFYVKFLRDIGMLDFGEPFKKLFHQGMLHAEDGRKMSKSFGNVVEPIETMRKYGVDATRWFLISVASPDKDFDWSEKGILGATRFIKKVFEFYSSFVDGKDSEDLVSRLNLCVKNIGNYYDSFEYRKATIEIRELFGELEKGCSKDSGLKFLKLIAPICPHVAEELWEKIGGKGLVSVASWPKVDEKVIRNKGQGISSDGLNEKIVERIKGILKSDTKKVYIYVMPFEIGSIDKEKILRDIRDSKLDIREVRVFAVNDSKKIDPAGRANKAKPGMASIYLE